MDLFASCDPLFCCSFLLESQTAKANVVCLTTKVVSVPTIAAAGNGYHVGDHIAFATGAGTQVVFSVATLTGGAGTGVASLTIVSGGAYTTNPTLSATAATVHTTGTGDDALTLNISDRSHFGVNTFSTSANFRGVYTVNATGVLTTTSLYGSGTTITMANSNYGVNTFHVTDGGSYSVAPTNPVSVTLSAGSGFTITGAFGGSVTQILFDNKQSATPEELYVNESAIEIAAEINALSY